MVTSTWPKSSPSSVKQASALSRAVRWESATCSLYSRRLHAASDFGHCGQRMGAVKGHSRLPTRSWVLLVGSVVLIAGHALGFRYALSRKVLSSTVVAA